MVFKVVDYLERALEMALKERITVYDAAYIALAEDKSTVLYTSDREQNSALVFCFC
jgi:predicted nucleic acid-binding protein